MVLFLAGDSPILNFELVQNFIFYVQVLVTASDWAEDLCSHRGVQGQEGCRGLKTGSQDWPMGQEAVCLCIRRRLWHIYQCKDGYISIYIVDRYRRYVEFTVVNCEKEIYI